MSFSEGLARWFRRPVVQRSVRPRLETLEDRTTPTAGIQLISNSFDVPSSLTQIVPLSLQTQPSAGTTVTYTAQSTNAQVTTQVVTSTEAWDLNVSGKDSSGNSFTGDLIVQLFPNESPVAVGRIVQLTNAGFYNGLTFQRVIQNFVIQGGDPNGNGNGGSSLGNFNDEFSSDLSFNSPGLVAFANSGPDTNNSQFYITDVGLPLADEPLNLNFRYDIYGQLVSGFGTLSEILSTPVGANPVTGENSFPQTSVVINKATIIDDPAVAVLKIAAPAGFTGSSTINLTANDGSGPTTAAFGVNFVTPTVNNPPFLSPIANQTTFAGTPVTFQIPATDIEGDPLTYIVSDPNNFGNTPANVSVSVTASGQVTVTPNSGFIGTTQLLVGVRDQTARTGAALTAQSQYDTHVITLTVEPNTGQAPFINPLALPTVADGTTLTFTAYGVAPTSGGAAVPLTYSLAAGAPVGASIDPNSGVVTFSPSEANDQEPGTYALTVVATETNNTSLSGSQTFAVTVGPTAVNQGTGVAARQTVALGLTQSNEYYTDLIVAAYNKYLGRGPDSNGLTYWLYQFQHGQTDEELEAGFFDSAEYIGNHGGPGSGWITGMYNNLLGRTPASNEVQFWLTQLQNGATPPQVALGFTASPEREGDRVQADYQTYLGRSASTAEVNYWVNVFITGGTNEQIIAGFVGSQEYFQANGGNVVDWLYAAYRAALNRQPSGSDLQYWGSRS